MLKDKQTSNIPSGHTREVKVLYFLSGPLLTASTPIEQGFEIVFHWVYDNFCD